MLYDNSIFIFLRNSHIFLQRLYHFTLLPAVHKGSNFSTCSPTLVLFCFVLILNIPIDVQYYIIVLLICRHSIFSCAYWIFVCLLWKKDYLNSFAYFLICSFFIVEFQKFLKNVFLILIPSQIYDLPVFYPILWVAFLLC